MAGDTRGVEILSRCRHRPHSHPQIEPEFYHPGWGEEISDADPDEDMEESEEMAKERQARRKINKEYLRELKNKETAPKQVVKGQLKQKGRMEEKDEKDKDEANSGGSDL